jgi:hypothetical protein
MAYRAMRAAYACGRICVRPYRRTHSTAPQGTRPCRHVGGRVRGGALSLQAGGDGDDGAGYGMGLVWTAVQMEVPRPPPRPAPRPAPPGYLSAVPPAALPVSGRLSLAACL